MAKEKKAANIGELNYGTKEWQNAWDALGPQDQQSIMGLSYDPSANLPDEAPYDFGETSQYAMDPMYAQMAQSGGGVALPYFTSAGKLEKYDLPQEQGRVNLMQDNATSMADLVLAAMSGPGAIDPQAFAPVVTKPTDRVATPGMTQLDRYARGTGYKAFIAKKIKDEGATDDEAIADLYNFLDAPDSETVDPKLKALRQEIIDSMPSAYKTGDIVPPSGRGTGGGGSAAGGRGSQDTRDLFDESAVGKWANDLYFKVADDQANEEAGWRDPESGFLYSSAPTQEDSPAMQKFRNLGLPSPFAAYNDPEYLRMAYDTMAPNLGNDIATREQTMADTAAERDRVGKETSGVIDRNINTQKLYGQSQVPSGFRMPGAPPAPPAPPSPSSARGQTQTNPETGGLVDASGHGVLRDYNPGGLPMTDANGHAIMRDFAPAGSPPAPGAPTPAPPGQSMLGPFGMGQAQAAPWQTQQLKGLVNPQGGFDFGGAHPAEQQAMANRLLNFVSFGGGNRGTKTATLDAGTAKKSAQQADEARKKFSKAYDRSWEASQYTSPDIGNAVRALAAADFQARSGNTPFIDVANQRKLGQRMMGVRA